MDLSEHDPEHGAPIGYLPRWSYRPSEQIDVHVFSTRPWTADIVRLDYGDPRPGGPPRRESPIGVSSGRQEALSKPTYPGSMAWAPVTTLPARYAMVAWIRPSRPVSGSGQLVAGQTNNGVLAWGLGISADGRWTVLTQTDEYSSSDAVTTSEWYLAELVVDASRRSITLMVDCMRLVTVTDVALHADGEAQIGLGGCLPRHRQSSTLQHGTFDGVIAEPSLARGALTKAQVERILRGASVAEVVGQALLANWTFPAGQRPIAQGSAIRGVVRVRNTPAAAMPGPHGMINALHCHSDDVTDAEWPIGVQLEVPADTPSGIYAVRLRSQCGIDRIPFIVPPTVPTHSRVLLLLPTMTYLAYANEQMPAPGNYLASVADEARPGRMDRWLARHPEYGFSVYDCHADGSGVNYSSLRRPIPNIRPDYLHWHSGEPRHLGADLYIVDWLNRIGIPYDVACDHDLDQEKLALLNPYRVIITGSHPEYWTTAMLEALERYLDRDGRLMYLGGNGFYWTTSNATPANDTIEVRRGPNGYPWRSSKNESIHAFDAVQGGFWRDNGRAPQDLVGINSIAMGPEDPAPGYTLCGDLPTAHKWITDGIAQRVIGTRGRLMGGAAGHEIDCVDDDHETPAGVTIVASSSGHADSLELVPDRAGHETAASTLTPHADLVLFQRPRGGTILSTGSICWAGSLPEHGGDPDVQRLTLNVLLEFLRSPYEPHTD